MLTKEVIGQSGLSVVSLVDSSILSNEVKDTVLEELDEEIILMDYDEFDNWDESFTSRECDVMAMNFEFAEFKAEKLAKEAVAGAGLVAPTINFYYCVNSTLYFRVTLYLCVTYQSRTVHYPRHYGGHPQSHSR